jgi:hypothetical protein
LRLLENRVVRRISGSKREKMTEGWRKLYKEELHILYPSPNVIKVLISKQDVVGGTCSTHRTDEKCIRNFRRA